jgi:hypothetical protein
MPECQMLADSVGSEASFDSGGPKWHMHCIAVVNRH